MKNSFGYDICPRCRANPIFVDGETICDSCSYKEAIKKDDEQLQRRRRQSRYETDFLLFKILLVLMAVGIGLAVLSEVLK
jgi:hypothetical protein